jgi:hypothetical protein
MGLGVLGLGLGLGLRFGIGVEIGGFSVRVSVTGLGFIILTISAKSVHIIS